MAEGPKSRREAEEALRARELAEASDASLEAGERLVGTSRLLDVAAQRFWRWERETMWPPIQRAWLSASDALGFVHEIFPAAGVEAAFAELLAAGDAWTHPSQVLPRPRPPYRRLAALARGRLRTARGSERERLARVLARLEAADRLEETARRRRERRGGL